MKKTAAFLSLGCKVNSYETEAMRGMFEAAGYDIVNFKDIADVYVINTCTVTNIADRKSRQMLHQAKKRNPQAVIAAVGCYVQASEEALTADNAVDLVVGNNKKSDIVAMVERCMSSRKKEELIADMKKEKDYEDLSVVTTMEKTRAFIKIQDGCNRFCSYCIIPYVRGRVRSRREDEILSEVSSLAQKGYREIVLTGIHISSYGTDFIRQQMEAEAEITPEQTSKQLPSEVGKMSAQAIVQAGAGKKAHEQIDIAQNNAEAMVIDGSRMPLAELIVKIGRIKGVERIRLGSLEPRIITEEFLETVSKVKQFCPHFHLSLQSGSDSVLSRMNRKYTAEEYFQKVTLIRKFFERPSFTTDIIVGFPGETNEEFNETLNFVKKVGFLHIHVFKYSKRAGTKAAAMSDQVSEEVKNFRSNELISISELISKEYKADFMGRIEKILFEEEITVDGRKYQVGHNERYLKAAVPCDKDLSNQIHTVKICNYLTDEIMLCEIIH